MPNRGGGGGGFWQKTRLFPDFHLCTLPLVRFYKCIVRRFVVVRCISFLCASVQQSLILSPKVAAAFSCGFWVVVNIPYIAHFLLSSGEYLVNPNGWLFRCLNLPVSLILVEHFSSSVLGQISAMHLFLEIGLLLPCPSTWTLPSFPFSGVL